MNRKTTSLKNKNCLVIGGSGLIGEQVVKLFHKNECNVAFTYYSNQKKSDELSQYGKPFKLDFSDIHNANLIIDDVIQELGNIDIFINCYGPIIYKKLKHLTLGEFKIQIEANLLTAFVLTRKIVEHMKTNKWGRVVNVAAAGADKVEAKNLTLPYHIAKSGVIALTKSYAREYAEDNITINAVSPGILKEVPDAEKGSISGKFNIPAGRKGSALEVARVIKFLAEPESEYITGQNINIDGGWSL